MGGPAFGRALPDPVIGYALSRLDDGRVVAGRLRLRLLEQDLGLLASPSIGGIDDVRPGRYALTVFGPASRVIPSLDLPPGTRLGTARPWSASFAGGFLSRTGTELHPTFDLRFTTTDRTFTTFGLADRADLPLAYAASYTCLVPAADTCAEQALRGEATGLMSITGSGGGGLSAADNQPGELAPGSHRRLFEQVLGSLGTRIVGFWLAFEAPTMGSVPSPSRSSCPGHELGSHGASAHDPGRSRLGTPQPLTASLQVRGCSLEPPVGIEPTT
ncbi:hypothetical protein GCM10022215_25230 [Nocardioides fonticola]|uniref:Uncharacterized protein n=1 Tax=Nocardioides fonticola TaxID=450363 RepID=A0ABP7XLR7_9ACTN